ncbi:MAG TPA: L-glutamate gamma-semialdehyde dehydrogenase [Thermoanaerobaculia bacterium]|nr:L-glutamate gamma-semialdehyde dehydrogenase [Thermoanaerobaculia bacterium]
MLPEFKNEPFTDFAREPDRTAMEQALAKVRSQLGKTYPIVIDGKRIDGLDTFESFNPSTKQVIATFQSGTRKHANEAVEVAAKAFETWKRETVETRVELLVKAAELLRKRKHEFSAAMVVEVGKSWAEADGDTAEAIDFLEFYAREAQRYAGPQPLVEIPNEKNALTYIPLGVGAVIPPWNFPLAIMAGMTVAAIVTGNSVVLKPSSDAPWIAYRFFQLLEEAGIPAGVVNFVSGGGEEVGDTLVRHPKVRFVAFTGSKEVGLHINEQAAKTPRGQLWIKRVVAEMGGKDAIIVDSDCNIEEAAAAVVASAFGFQGQKCSACSRAIVDKTVYDEFVGLVAEKTQQLKVGDPADSSTQFGPVVNKSAFKKISSYIEKGMKEGRLIAGGTFTDKDGYFISPTVIADVHRDATIAQEEIFGPVLAIIKAENFDDALEIANDTPYGLTGAVFSNDAEKIRMAEEDFFVGNLYFNRKCTGALVGVHPFGGFNMSGTDSKAGGRDYLLLFLQAKLVSHRLVPSSQAKQAGSI